MDIELILKLAGVGLTVALLSQILTRAGREEQATLVSLGGIIVALFVLVGELGSLIEAIRGVFGI